MRTHHRLIVLLVVAATIAIRSAAVLAGDAFFDIPLGELKISSGELPKAATTTESFRFDPRGALRYYRAVLDGEGEAYLNIGAEQRLAFQFQATDDLSTCHLLIRAPQGKDISGKLALPTRDSDKMTLVSFSVPAAKANDSAQERFWQEKTTFYLHLASQPTVPGTAWFRHELNAAAEQANKLRRKEGKAEPSIRVVGADPARITESYELFTGGRAVSESVQLDRLLREPSQSGPPTVDISTLKGITIAEIDWKPLLKGAKPQLDPLAAVIPADQHALFFPSFAAVTKVFDEANGRDTDFLRMVTPKSEDADVAARYQRQLGLTLTSVGRAVGPAVIRSVALTGSDPYFPTGTDVAVLFETDQQAALASALQAQIQIAAAKQPDAKPQHGEVEGIAYHGMRSPDRQLCTYVAQLRGAVVVTNSLAQLGRLAKIGKGVEPIASLDEYKFFRIRYPLGDKSETALLFLSDATIRRWCSPQWRIASARRTFTAAALADLTADNVKTLESGRIDAHPLHTDLALIDAGELMLTNYGASSSNQGTLAWMTPIVEMPIEKVTQAEADAYNQWRDNYQRNWRWAFDPIALRIGINGAKLSADLTVMPLVANSEYNEFINLSRGAELKPDAGDRHAALAHVILSINTKSEPVQRWGNLATTFVRGIEPFGWLGNWVSVYVDDDPFWKELAQVPPEKQEEFMRHAWGKLPIALEADVSNGLKLTAFLAALHGFIDQTAPGMTTWEPLTYRDQPYVRIKPTETARKQIGEDANAALYYVPAADSLTVSFNENVIKSAIDRRLTRASGATGNGNRAPHAAEPPLAWLGSNFCLQVDHRMLDMLLRSRFEMIGGSESLSEAAMQMRSWGNIPILNQWKRLFPTEDPVKVHERLWHTTLVCPGGGKYVWNDEWKTMESTVYGHPGQPKTGPQVPAGLNQFQTANFGLTFEDHGLRARVELNRDAK